MIHLSTSARCRRHPSQYIYLVLLGILWIASTIEGLQKVDSSQIRTLQSRKLISSPDPDLDGNFSREDLQKLLTLLEGSAKEAKDGASGVPSLEHAPTLATSELKHITLNAQPRLRESSSTLSTTTTTTTTDPPVSRYTTRRFYRRLRRKPTAATTESSTTTTTTSPTTVKVEVLAESPRLIESGPSPVDLLQQLSLLNGILGALNASSASAPTAMSITTTTSKSNATPVPDILALLAGAKNIVAESSMTSEVIVPPPSPSAPSSSAGQIDDPAAALALLNLFSSSNNQNKEAATSGASSSAAANLLNLVAQSQMAAQVTTPPAQIPDVDAAAALTKLLLQSSGSHSAPSLHGNSLNQATQQSNNAGASANQLNNLLGLLGALGTAGQQQPQAGGINNLFNLGGDQLAQAQTNSLTSLFGSQQQQQPAQTQNLLNLFGGNQGNQGFNLASLLAPQTGNSIPGLGLLSTVSGLGSSIFSSVANIFGGSKQDGKPRVRGKGVDTRVGLGYRLGNVGDAQVVWEIGPQLFTDPLRNEMRPYTTKRESGLPTEGLQSHYFQPSINTASEKETQKDEANRRMVQAAIQQHYRNNHFSSAYPQPARRSSNYGYTPTKKSSSDSHNSSSSSFLSAIPFADHLRGFWSGITSGLTGSEDDEHNSSYDFDDVKTDFSNNLMKRSSPDYLDYESRAYHPRRRDEDANEPSHSTLTEYEKLLLQHGKKIGGVANTEHGVVDDTKPSESLGFFSRWFKGSSSSTPKAQTPRPVLSSQHSESEWLRRSDPYPTKKSASVSKPSFRPSQPSPSVGPYGEDFSYNRRNDVEARSNGNRRRGNPRPPPQRRRNHNPFRNWISAFKPSKPRHQPQPSPSYSSYPSGGGFGRRYFKRPSSASGNPQLQHFTNMNKDLLMADANDDFVESAGVESYVPAYQQPQSYQFAREFPDVSLAQAPRRQRPLSSFNSQASVSQSERIVEPALLFDHLDVNEDSGYTEADESFHNRNKVVVNPALREVEKKKVLGKATLKNQEAITKYQRLLVNNANKLQQQSDNIKTTKQRVVVKSKGKSPQNYVSSGSQRNKGVRTESTTALPSVFGTISSIFSGTTKPKLKTLLQNATSFLPSLRILPRKKTKKEENLVKTKLTMQNGKPSIIVPMTHDDDDEEDLEEAADEVEPVVQVGHDMSFTDLQSLFGAKNNTKRRRFRIRVKDSKGDKEVKSRKDSEESGEAEDGTKDIFVDIESGEVSVLKPVASLVSFAPKKEEPSEEEVDYYEDDDGDGVADVDMNRKEHIFDAIQTHLVKNFEKMKKAELRAEAKKRRKQELASKGMDESMDDVTKFFDLLQNSSPKPKSSSHKLKQAGGLSF